MTILIFFYFNFYLVSKKKGRGRPAASVPKTDNVVGVKNKCSSKGKGKEIALETVNECDASADVFGGDITDSDGRSNN